MTDVVFKQPTMRLWKVNSEKNISFFELNNYQMESKRSQRVKDLTTIRLSYRVFAARQLFRTHACSDVVFYNVCGIGVFMSDIWPASVDYTVQDMSVT